MLWERDSILHHAAEFTSDVRGLKQGKHALCVFRQLCPLLIQCQANKNIKSHTDFFTFTGF